MHNLWHTRSSLIRFVWHIIVPTIHAQLLAFILVWVLLVNTLPMFPPFLATTTSMLLCTQSPCLLLPLCIVVHIHCVFDSFLSQFHSHMCKLFFFCNAVHYISWRMFPVTRNVAQSTRSSFAGKCEDWVEHWFQLYTDVFLGFYCKVAADICTCTP